MSLASHPWQAENKIFLLSCEVRTSFLHGQRIYPCLPVMGRFCVVLHLLKFSNSMIYLTENYLSRCLPQRLQMLKALFLQCNKETMIFFDYHVIFTFFVCSKGVKGIFVCLFIRLICIWHCNQASFLCLALWLLFSFIFIVLFLFQHLKQCTLRNRYATQHCARQYWGMAVQLWKRAIEKPRDWNTALLTASIQDTYHASM